MVRFYWRLIKHTPVILWRALRQLDTFAGVLTLLFGMIGIGAWRQLLPLWTPFAAFGFILLYGFLRANYEDYLLVEAERDEEVAQKERLERRLATDERRTALKNLLGSAHEKGEIAAELWEDDDSERYQQRKQEWVWNTYALIEAAFDKGEARRFLSNQGYKVEGFSPMDNLRVSANPLWMDARLWRLEELILRVDRERLNIRPDFDPQDWA